MACTPGILLKYKTPSLLVVLLHSILFTVLWFLTNMKYYENYCVDCRNVVTQQPPPQQPPPQQPPPQQPPPQQPPPQQPPPKQPPPQLPAQQVQVQIPAQQVQVRQQLPPQTSVNNSQLPETGINEFCDPNNYNKVLCALSRNKADKWDRDRTKYAYVKPELRNFNQKTKM